VRHRIRAMTSDPLDLDAVGLAEAIHRGELSPVEAVEAAVLRIEAVNPSLNAVIHPRFDRAIEEARGDLPEGPFQGVPLLVKDLGCGQAGEPRHDGMRAARDAGWIEAEDAPLTTAFLAAGFVIVGRTNTPELGLLATTEPEAHGPTRNPWDTGRSAGGSSGGSAAAVAARMVPVAHGGDSGGSIRIPSSACGLVGLKPSAGRTPSGAGAETPLGIEHIVARTVRDTATVLDAIASKGEGSFAAAAAAAGEPPGRLRVGMTTVSPGGFVPVHPDCVAAAEGLGRALAGLGHDVTDDAPAVLSDVNATVAFLNGLGVAFGAEARSGAEGWEARLGRAIRAEDLEIHTWALVQMGRGTDPDLAEQGWAGLRAYAEAVLSWWKGFDLLVTPTLAEPPPPLGEFVSTAEEPMAGGLRAGRFTPFTTPFNATGQPAISVPAAWTEDGLPIGVQLIAAPGREDVLIRVAAALEDDLGWSERRPPVVDA